MTNDSITRVAWPDFSRLVHLTQLNQAGEKRSIIAGAEERLSIATFLGLRAVEQLDGQFALVPSDGESLRLSGSIFARVIHNCSVSLQPVATNYNIAVDRTYNDGAAEKFRKPATDFAPEDPDPPELTLDGKLDLADIMLEYLSLHLDPYPRAPGIVFDGFIEGDEGSQQYYSAENNPFAALSRLKSKLKK